MNLQKYTTYKDIEDLKRLDFITESIIRHVPGNGKILDVGCGNGNISLALGALGYDVTGIDMDETTISNANKRNSFSNVNFKVQNAFEIDTHNKFDAVICSEVLEHLDDPGKFVSAIYGLIKTGGVFVATVPNGYGPRELIITKPVQFLNKKGFDSAISGLKKLFGFSNSTLQSSSGDLTHIQFFTKRRFTDMITNSGFKKIGFAHGNFMERVLPFSVITKRSKFLQKVDCHTADLLPSFAVSAFYSSWLKN